METRKRHPKKVLHKTLSERLQPMLHDIKESFIVNEKKLEKAVKGAAAYIADHLHLSDKKTKKLAKRSKSTGGATPAKKAKTAAAPAKVAKAVKKVSKPVKAAVKTAKKAVKKTAKKAAKKK